MTNQQRSSEVQSNLSWEQSLPLKLQAFKGTPDTHGVIKAIPETRLIFDHFVKYLGLLLVSLLLTFLPVESSFCKGRDLRAPKNVFVQETTT